MVRIQAEQVKGKDLKPGDLFSAAGSEYWDHFEDAPGVGEKAYIRTSTPAEFAPDMDEVVYRLTIVRDEDTLCRAYILTQGRKWLCSKPNGHPVGEYLHQYDREPT
jgi:hypothetical protein